MSVENKWTDSYILYIVNIEIDKMGSKTIIKPVFLLELPRLSYNFEQFNSGCFKKIPYLLQIVKL